MSIAATAVWTVATASVTAALFVAWLAGWRLEIVRTASMSPAVPSGSVAVVVPVGMAQVRVGDVVAYRDATDARVRVLHRVVRVSDRREAGGDVYLYTQGDANATRDPLYVGRDRLLGRLRWSLPRFGGILWTLRPPVGPLVFVGVPAIFMIVKRLVLGQSTARRRRGRAVHPDGRGTVVTTPTFPSPLWGGRSQAS